MRLVIAGMLVAGTVHAEPRDAVCKLPESYPACRVTLLFDVGARGAPVGFTPAEGSSPASSTLELGFMVNFAPAHSVVFSGGWVFDADHPAAILRPRYRYWPHRYLAVEGSTGVLIKRRDNPDVPGAGWMFEAAVTLADVVGVTATVEHYPGHDTYFLYGVRFGFGALIGPSLLCPGCRF